MVRIRYAHQAISVSHLLERAGTVGENTRVPVASMPGVERITVDLVVDAAREVRVLAQNIPC